MTLLLAFLALAILVAIAVWLLLKLFIQRRYEGLVKRYGEACVRHGLTPKQVPLGPYDLMLMNHGLEPEAPKDHKMNEIARRMEQNRLNHERIELELAQSRTPDPKSQDGTEEALSQTPSRPSTALAKPSLDATAGLGFLRAPRLGIQRRKAKKPPK